VQITKVSFAGSDAFFKTTKHYELLLTDNQSALFKNLFKSTRCINLSQIYFSVRA